METINNRFHFVAKIVRTTWIVILSLSAMSELSMGQTHSDSRAEPLPVGSEKQLFIDELFFEESQNINLRIHPALKTGERNVQRDRPWESATLNWFSVMDDGGKYRLWYECYDAEGWYTGDDTSFCYAESEDGVHWNKPNLGLFSYYNGKQNNILFRQIGMGDYLSRVHGTCVFKDPSASAKMRYKAVSQGLFHGARYDRPHRIAGMYSAEGLVWERFPDPVCNVFADSQDSAFWDDRLEKYVLYGRAGAGGRAIGRSESEDFTHFEPLQLVLRTDDKDPPDSDLYNPAALKYPYAANVYLMFPSLFQHGPQTLDIRLAVSRDGIHWSRPERRAFVSLGKEGEFDSGSLYMGQGLIRKGNELWQYYGGSQLKHDESKLDDLVKPGNSRTYSRVITRIDGYVSADAGDRVGWFVTPPLIFKGDALRLNVSVRDGGHLRIALLDDKGNPIKGRSTEECQPITSDHTNVLIRWKTGTDVSFREGIPTKMRVEMKSASLYAFQFVSSSSEQR